MRMDCYKIKIYYFRKAVIMLTPIPINPGLQTTTCGRQSSCLCFWAHSVLTQWQLVPSPSQHPFLLQVQAQNRPKSIHSYLCQTKSKSFMPFLGRRQLFFSQFYWQLAISGSWNMPKRKSFLPLPLSLLHPRHTHSPFSDCHPNNVTHFIKLCNARIIAQIRTKQQNCLQLHKRVEIKWERESV